MASALGQQTRIFELDEAQRMLPLVRSIVKGMIDDHAERQRALERLDALGEQDPPARSRLAAEIDSLTEKLVEAANELQELGVEFKGIDLGLVDFPCRRDGELVYLCWRYGEERIGFWHPVDAGYAGRRPIEPD
jgi:hypothetical protein